MTQNFDPQPSSPPWPSRLGVAAPPRRPLVEVRWPFRRTSGVGGTFSLSTNDLCVGVDRAPFVAVADGLLSLIGVECAEGKGGEEDATDIVQGSAELTVWVSES